MIDNAQCANGTQANCSGPNVDDIECGLCKEGFYKNDEGRCVTCQNATIGDLVGCIPENIVDCDGMDPNAIVCANCQDGYYLSNGKNIVYF